MIEQLGRYGVFRHQTLISPDLAASIENLGYGTLWAGGSTDPELRAVETLLDATRGMVVATGILNIWGAPARTVATAFHRIDAAYPGRFMLGLGVGHRETNGTDYVRQYDAIRTYLDELDAADVSPQRRVLAALGPRMLQLAAERTLGAHPYMVPPRYIAGVRATSPRMLLAPAQAVVVDDDAVRARALGRAVIDGTYLRLENYRRNFRVLGFSAADLDGGGSDRLIDALLVHGPPTAVAGGLGAHLAASADHVAISLFTQPDADPLAGFRALAGVLFD